MKFAVVNKAKEKFFKCVHFKIDILIHKIEAFLLVVPDFTEISIYVYNVHCLKLKFFSSYLTSPL